MHVVDLHETNSSSPWCLENECWSLVRKHSQIHKLRVIHHQWGNKPPEKTEAFNLLSSESARIECWLKWSKKMSVIAPYLRSVSQSTGLFPEQSYLFLHLAHYEYKITCAFGVSGSCLSWCPQVFYLSDHRVT